MTARTLIAAACSLFLVAAVQAQNASPTREVPALAGGELTPGGLRAPVYRTDVDLTRSTVADGFTFAAGGDLLGPYNPLTQLGEPGARQMLKLFKDADVGFANHEASSFDLPGPAGTTQAAQNGGGYPRFSTALNRDFRAMGIKMVSMANNTRRLGPRGAARHARGFVQASGLVQAGAGASLSDARNAAVVYTPKGNVGLIATASTFNPATVAADGQGALKPRPGISVLRAIPIVSLTDEQMVLMRRLSAASWAPNSGVRDEQGAVTVGGITYRSGSQRGSPIWWTRVIGTRSLDPSLLPSAPPT